MFPNPSNGTVTINANDKIDRISILDHTGRVVYYQDAIRSTNMTTETNLAAGMYIMQVAVNGSIANKSLIIR